MSDLVLVFLILNLAVLVIFVLLAVAIVRTGVLWALKDFEKWKAREKEPDHRAQVKADRSEINRIYEEESRRPAGPKEEAKYRR